MDLFHIIDDGAAVLRVKGRHYKQAKIYHRGAEVFAEAGANSFIRLIRGGGTSDPGTNWLDVAGPGVSVLMDLPTWTQPPAPKTLSKLTLAPG